MFKKATKTASRLRLGLCGTSGSGKTYSALAIATALGGKVAVIDTEHGSAAKYSDIFDFDVLDLDSFEAEKFTAGIRAAAAAGYDVVVIDSLSHAWMGTGGTLDQVEEAKRRNTNSFTAWRDPSKQNTELIESIIHARCHVIATMRSKTEYVMEEDARTGKKVPKKVGMAPIQRNGVEYEFDVVGDMQEGTLVISKTRCPALAGKSFHHPGAALGATLLEWLGGAPVAPTGPSAEATAASAEATAASAEATAAFAAACAANNREPKPEATAMIAHYGAGTWANITDADIAAYVATMRPAQDTAAMLREACAAAGVVVTEASAELMTEAGVLRWEDVPVENVVNYIAGLSVPV